MARSFWGWGDESSQLDDAAVDGLGAVLAARFGDWRPAVVPRPVPGELRLRDPRISPPAALAPVASTDPVDRAGHTYGKAFVDVVRALRRQWTSPPDLVLRPRDSAEVGAVLDWCSGAGIAVVPYGGGSSVVGGVETDCPDADAVVSLDLGAMDRLLDFDPVSSAAHVESGLYGPALEDRLRPEGFTLRHFPQSFEYSTVGGWIATRSGGHFATGSTHIDDFVEAIAAQTPQGPIETRRLPASGAGPSPDRLLIGSEGALGVITSAWLRVLRRPSHRASATVSFPDLRTGAEACRQILQAGFLPANCRLLDATEAVTAGLGTGDRTILLLAWESAHQPVTADLDAALDVALGCGGDLEERRSGGAWEESGGGAAGRWRSAFMGMPYLRDGLVRTGAVTETFETCVTWDRFDELHASVIEAAGDVLSRVCGGGFVSCRFTHVYRDGPAPYFTVVAPSRLDRQIEDWTEVKAAVSEVLLACGATITHHHAVGRTHMPWYERQRPDLFGAVLAAAKRTLDPAGILNPGVLV